MRLLGSLILTALLIGACTATPITLPFNDGGGLDAPQLRDDLYAAPDSWKQPPGGDAGAADAAAADAAFDAAATDGLVDGLCLECPLPDGMLDGGGDAEAGSPTEAGPTADVLVVDMAAGE
jgi:hypothetical protein